MRGCRSGSMGLHIHAWPFSRHDGQKYHALCCCMCMQTHGTIVDRKQIAPNKPSALKNGSQIRFGNHPSTFILRCESAGRCPEPMYA